MSLGKPIVRGKRHGFPCPCRCGTTGFCPAHRARLAAIREELDESRFNRSLKAARDRSPGIPVCCNPHCWNAREPGQLFCWEHEGDEEDK